MDALIDCEYIDPEWPDEDPDYNIFSTYGFNKLSDTCVKNFISSATLNNSATNSLLPLQIRVITKEFSVIYDYSYRAWIEQRTILQKKSSKSSSESADSTCKYEKGEKARDVSKFNTPRIETYQISNKTNNKWEFTVPLPQTQFKESCKTVPLFHTLIDCDDCEGKGEKHCKKCNSTGFMTCPQCRGIGFGRSIAGMSHSMGHKSGSGVGHCNRCHATKTVQCTQCTFSKGSRDRKCKKCEGRGNKRTDINLKVTWVTHEDRVCIGKHTRSIPKNEIIDSFGIELQEWSSEPLSNDICPDRPDLVELSCNNHLRLVSTCPGRVRENGHKLRALPLCFATCEIIEGQYKYFQNIYIIGSVNCKLILGKKVYVNMEKRRGSIAAQGWGKVRHAFSASSAKSK